MHLQAVHHSKEHLRQPRVWLSVLLFFSYVGGEAALGTWIYTLLTESRGIDPTVAGFWAGSYRAIFMVGRVVAGLFARRAEVNLLVTGGLAGALLGAHFAANTIGMQMAATGLGTAVIPGLMGVFARQISLEVIPVCLLIVYAGLFRLYMLAVKSGSKA